LQSRTSSSYRATTAILREQQGYRLSCTGWQSCTVVRRVLSLYNRPVFAGIPSRGTQLLFCYIFPEHHQHLFIAKAYFISMRIERGGVTANCLRLPWCTPTNYGISRIPAWFGICQRRSFNNNRFPRQASARYLCIFTYIMCTGSRAASEETARMT
jgi:hypothetical protein